MVLSKANISKEHWKLHKKKTLESFFFIKKS